MCHHHLMTHQTSRFMCDVPMDATLKVFDKVLRRSTFGISNEHIGCTVVPMDIPPNCFFYLQNFARKIFFNL